MSIRGSKTLGRDQKFAGEDFLMNLVAKDLSLYVVVSDLAGEDFLMNLVAKDLSLYVVVSDLKYS